MQNSFLEFLKFLLLIPKWYLNPLSPLHEKILGIFPPNLHHQVKRYISGKLYCIQIFSENHRFQSIPLLPSPQPSCAPNLHRQRVRACHKMFLPRNESMNPWFPHFSLLRVYISCSRNQAGLNNQIHSSLYIHCWAD